MRELTIETVQIELNHRKEIAEWIRLTEFGCIFISKCCQSIRTTIKVYWTKLSHEKPRAKCEYFFSMFRWQLHWLTLWLDVVSVWCESALQCILCMYLHFTEHGAVYFHSIRDDIWEALLTEATSKWVAHTYTSTKWFVFVLIQRYKIITLCRNSWIRIKDKLSNCFQFGTIIMLECTRKTATQYFIPFHQMSIFSHNWLTTTTIHSTRKETTEYNLIYNFFVYTHTRAHTMPRETIWFAHLTVSHWISNSKSEIQSAQFRVVWHVCFVPQPTSRHSTQKWH